MCDLSEHDTNKSLAHSLLWHLAVVFIQVFHHRFFIAQFLVAGCFLLGRCYHDRSFSWGNWCCVVVAKKKDVFG